ncbi:MAG: hypothetical protein ISS50_00870 [Anaerolineae bacterium]|nr:hypothetical protein [Anaerolineae bacterium]
MTFTEESLPITSEDPEAAFGESDEIEGHEVETGRFAGLIKGFRGYLPGLTFVAGLLLGWLVIGWWLWPVQWTNSAPWHLSLGHQRTFIRLVAEDYWLTGNVSQVKATLAGWDDEALANLLATLEAQAPSPEERQRLVALAKALEMPDAVAPSSSFVTSLLSQKTILLGVILSASPLVVAMILAISRLRGKAGPRVPQVQWIEAQQAQVRGAPGQQVGKQEEIISETALAQPQEQEAAAQQPGVPQAAGPQTEEQQEGAAQQPGMPPPRQEEPTQIEQMQDWLGQMRERLAQLRTVAPQVQDSVAQMQEHLQHVLEQLAQMQAKATLAGKPETPEDVRGLQGYMGQLQERLKSMQDELPEDTPPEIRAELMRMQLQMEELLAQIMGLAGEEPEEELDAVSVVDDLWGDLDDEEEKMSKLEALCEGLDDIDVDDLLQETQEAAYQLREGISLRSEPARG